MRIGTRLLVLLVTPLVCLLVLFGYLDQKRSRRLLEGELVREGRAITRTVQFAMEDALRDRQLADTRELVDQISGYERVLGLRIFDAEGEIWYKSPSLDPYPFAQHEALDRVLKERKPAETHRVIAGKPVVTYIVPLTRPSGDLFGAVQVIQLLSFVEEDAAASRNAVVALTGVLILATAGVILVVTRLSVGRPIEDLVRSFREVGSGDLSARVPVRRDDEFGRLAAEFNGMVERLERTQQTLQVEQVERRRMEGRLRNAQRLASLGQLAAGLAHEIGTPLNVIAGRAESLQRKLSGNEPADRSLGIITAQIDRISRIVRGMLDFARMREPSPVRLDLGHAVRSVVDLIDPRLESSGVRVELAVPPNLPRVVADSDRMQQVILNVISNALDAMPRGGLLRIEASHEPAASEPSDDARPCVTVTFTDTGEGIESRNLDRVFDPFFTTKEVGKGTGLGLSIAYGIVQEHGGWMEIESAVDRGTRVTVRLPAALDGTDRSAGQVGSAA
ncbi:MAG TPA: ATP-binding protein [Candidatus Polarisedimenticolia bacterium]|nr:ATP-binding protein [Candidatus Polarisedimenticolia bacterium]